MGICAIEKSGTLSPMSKDHWGEGNIYLRGKTYWVQYSIHGHRRRESTKTSDPNKARKFLRRKLTGAEGGDPKPTKILVGKLLDNLLAHYRTNRPKSAEWAELVINGHLREPFEYHRAATFGTEPVMNYVKARHAAGVCNATINRELALLRRSFSLGMEHDPPLTHRVPRIPKFTEGPARSGFFEAKDFERLCAELPEDIRDVAIFAYWTGCRRGEILGLRWPQIDLPSRIVRLEVTKNAQPREIPLSSELFEVLQRRWRERNSGWPSSPWVFTRKGKKISDYDIAWRSACARAKLTGNAALLHDLRRTGVRNLVRAGVPEKVVMLISGHKTRSVFDRYNIVQGDDLRDAMKKLEKHLGGQRRSDD